MKVELYVLSGGHVEVIFIFHKEKMSLRFAFQNIFSPGLFHIHIHILL